MDFNIDEYKINKNKIYLRGWYHSNKYKIIVMSDKEQIELKKYIPRFDICINFHEKILDNDYGFEEEISFKNNIEFIKIYVKRNEEKKLMTTIDNRKVYILFKKLYNILKKIYKGVRFFWREYRFLVPPTILIENIKKFLKQNKQITVYNPSIISEYNEWLNMQKNINNNETDLDPKSITIINNKEIINNINTKYTLIKEKNVTLDDNFYSIIKPYVNNNYDLIYFDNDMVKNQKFLNPIFKPDWSRDTLLGINYIGNCYLIKTDLLKQYKIINLYKILLDQIGRKITIKHISKIMYHDQGTIKNGKKELNEYFKEKSIDAKIIKNVDNITNTILYKLKRKPLVSIIIPVKNNAKILENCIKSIHEKTTYKNYEIIIIDNGSTEKEILELFKKYKKEYNNIFIKRIECEFNYSFLNNSAVKIAKGEYLLLLNNDVEVITPEWLEIMLGYALQKHIGTIGVKLLFPDNTIQHAGIIMGKGGLAGHAHYGKNKNYISPQYELKIPYNCAASTAACLMVSKKIYKEVNGLNEKIKVAFNDVDFNLKVLEKGYNNIVLPNVEMYHYESKTRGLDTTIEQQKRFAEEWKYINKTWKKYIEHDPYYNDNFSKDADYMLK